MEGASTPVSRYPRRGIVEENGPWEGSVCYWPPCVAEAVCCRSQVLQEPHATGSGCYRNVCCRSPKKDMNQEEKLLCNSVFLQGFLLREVILCHLAREKYL